MFSFRFAEREQFDILGTVGMLKRAVFFKCYPGYLNSLLEEVKIDSVCSTVSSMLSGQETRSLGLNTLGTTYSLRIGRPKFDPRPGRCVVSLSKRHLLPKSTGNTQE